MPRARAHAAARIDGAECTRALQVRRQWRRRIAPRDATGAECGASACGLTPRRRPRRRRRRRRKLLVLDDHRRHATVSSAFLRSPPVGARLRARRCTGPMPPASGPVAFQASEPRAERGAWCAEEAPERRAERGARSEVRAERGARCARATRGARCARSAERGAPERRAERGVPLASAFIRCCCCCCCRPGCVSSLRATRGAWCAEEAPERRAERGAMARMQSTVPSTSVSVRRRALSLLLEPVCVRSVGGDFDDSAGESGVYTGVPGERRLPLLA
jgi:hypothetical protein